MKKDNAFRIVFPCFIGIKVSIIEMLMKVIGHFVLDKSAFEGMVELISNFWNIFDTKFVFINVESYVDFYNYECNLLNSFVEGV